MRFWDASAVAPLLAEQPLSVRARTLLAQDPEMVVWWSTPVGMRLRLHPLRSANAFHLAAALECARSCALGEMVCFDGRLGEAAAREGFGVLGF